MSADSRAAAEQIEIFSFCADFENKDKAISQNHLALKISRAKPRKMQNPLGNRGRPPPFYLNVIPFDFGQVQGGAARVSLFILITIGAERSRNGPV